VKPDRRDAIHDAALALFAERGFHGTAVPAIAEQARVGAGTIYRYFLSKEHLVNVLYKKWKGALAFAVLNDFPLHAPVREQFRTFFLRAIDFARAHPLAFQFLELHHHARYLDEASRQLEVEVLAQASQVLQQARDGQIVKDTSSEVLMAIVWGAIVGLVKASWEGRVFLTEVVVEQAEECCWEAIRR
jgi:AcrR family transcriptional regulator